MRPLKARVGEDHGAHIGGSERAALDDELALSGFSVMSCSSEATGGQGDGCGSPMRRASRLDAHHAQSSPQRHRDRRVSRSSISSAIASSSL